MRRSISRPTPEEQRRQDDAREIGCIACLLAGHGGCGVWMVIEIHHQNSGGRNISQLHTVALCTWHHRGINPDGMSKAQAHEQIGPSFAHTPGQFRKAYGSDPELLESQNEVIEKWRGG